MKLLLSLLFAPLASAFVSPLAAPAPAAAAVTSSSLSAFEAEIGAQPPLGFWDPLGLLDDADQVRSC